MAEDRRCVASYAVFRSLRAAGAIGDGLRFQIGLPFPSSALNAFKADFAADYPVAERAIEDLFARELRRLLEAIPPEDLALQWISPTKCSTSRAC